MSTTPDLKVYSGHPYWDDYKVVDDNGKTVEDRNYYRILFQPGYAVQARELTQLQTSLQAQMSRFGQNFFKDGDPVVGGKCTLDEGDNLSYIKIEDVFKSTLASGSAASYTTSDYANEFVGTTITGRDNTGNQVKFKVSKVILAGAGPAHRTQPSPPDPITLYGKYVSSGGPNKDVGTFARGETFYSDGTPARYGKTMGENAASATEFVGTTAETNSALTDNSQTGLGSAVNIDEGVYFISGCYVHVASQSLMLDKYSNTPSYRVVLKVDENIVTSSTDTKLVDNATGVPNTAAPGANRYQINTTLYAEPHNINNRTLTDPIALLTVTNGVATYESTPEASVLKASELARRTYDESGNYAVNPFILDIKEHLNDGTNFGQYTNSEGGSAGKFVIETGANKAYVQGNEFFLGPQNLISVDKPRAATDKTTITGRSTLLEVGSYVKITPATMKGIPDVTTQTELDLRNSSNVVIGKARAKGLEYISGSGAHYRLYLYDIRMLEVSGTVQVFGSVQNIVQGAPTGLTQGFDAILNPVGQRFDIGKESLVYKLPFNVVAEDGHSSTWTYNVRIRVTDSNVSNSAASFTLPTGCVLANDDDIQVAVNAGATVEASTVTSGLNAQTFTLDSSDISGTISNGDKVQAIVTAKVTNARRRSKNYVTGTQVNVTLNSSLASQVYSLGKTDVIKLTSMTFLGEEYKDAFEFNDGQKESYYDVSTIELRGGRSVPNGTYVATFDHYTHSSGDFFDCNSYQSAHYTKIPSYNSTRGLLNLRDCVDFRSVEGSGSPTAGAEMSTGTDFSTALPPAPNAIFAHTSTSVYMPRMDKLILSETGKFEYKKGVPSLNPKAPKDTETGMTLYRISVAPYVFDMNGIKPIQIDNKRYTMRDIGKLDKRLKNLEYYTSLSLLEQSASSIYLDRHKNGFVVDGFHGHNIGNGSSIDYTCSVDKDRGVLRPKFDERTINLIRKSGDQSAALSSASTTAGIDAKAVMENGIVTLPHTTQEYIKQPYASYAEYINPYEVFVWEGVMKLSPESDVWKEVDVRPDVMIDDNSVYDQFVAMAEEAGILGTQWQEWTTNWTGIETTSETTQIDVSASEAAELGFTEGGGGDGHQRAKINETITATTETGFTSRSGTTTSISSDTQTKEVGSYVVETNFIPYMRSRKIYFDAEMLKPDTKLYAFFGGTNITAYCRQEFADSSAPYAHVDADFSRFATRTNIKTYENDTQHPNATSGGSTRGSLVTDASGRCIGSFILPRNSALKFKTGTKVFKITDSSTNASTANTHAQASYYAQGLLEVHQKTIISTKVPKLVTRELREDGTQVSRTSQTTSHELVKWYDPLAQTFKIGAYEAGNAPNNTEGELTGVFIRSVDLFFQTKDDSIPCEVSIRSVENGYPTQLAVPDATKVLYPGSINTHTTGNTATTVNFDSPIYLAPGEEYAIVLIANSVKYKLMVAEVGAKDIADTTKRITKQPYNGVFFKSANASTWTAEQTKDLKFTLNRCKFSGDKAEIILHNDAIPVKALGSSPFEYLTSTTIRVTHKNHNMYGDGTNNVTLAGFVAENGITDTDKINKTFTLDNNKIEHDSYVITHTGSATTTGIIGGGTTVTATEDQLYNVIHPKVQTLELPGTSIDLYLSGYTGSSQDSGASSWSTVSETRVLPNKDYTPPTTQAIAGPAQQAVVGGETATVRAVLDNGGNDYISPVIDMERCEVICISNRINDPSASAADYSTNSRLVAETSPTGGTAISKYITRKIDLAQEAQHLDVYLGVNRPTSSNIDVYYRVGDAGADEVWNSLPWVLLSSDQAIPINDSGRFSEVHYTKDFGNTDKFGAFAIKIVFRSSNNNNVPEVTDLRALATT